VEGEVVHGATVDNEASLWRSPAMRALVGVTVLGFASYFLTLASLPAYAVQGGARASTAGIVTAVLLVVTVAVQAVVPSLTARFGQARVLVIGLVALGAPSPFYAVDDGLLWLSALSAVRGAGFGVLTVLSATMAAQAAPVARRGEGLGIYGLSVAVPSLVAVPAGVALVLDGHPGWLAWLAASPVLGLAFLPTLTRAMPPAQVRGPAGHGRTAARAALAPSVVLFAVTLAGGGLVTFLPIERPDGALATAALLAFGFTGAVTRWRAGMLADRLGSRRLLPLALGLGAVGLVAVAAGLIAGDAWVLAGAAVFGAGYGAVQNLTLLAAFARAGEGGATAASAMWNASFDVGTAAGALGLGIVAVGIGLPWAYVLVAVLLVATLPVASAATRAAVQS
jgi:predicted MFS family arabinose efflux permease